MKPELITIGTRGSKLALWQANETRSRLLEFFPGLDVEISIIKTLGDTILDKALSKIGNKGLFTNELEQALLDGTIDVAVHSLKDLPTQLPDGLTLGAILPRGEVRDVFLSRDGRDLSDFTPHDKVATSSLRRQSQLLHHYPWLNVTDIRGNVDTRIRKMNEGYCEGLVLAGAGVTRLGMSAMITSYIDPSIIMPAVGQGAIALEINANNSRVAEICNAMNDLPTWKLTMAERAFLHAIKGGCQVPVACHTTLNYNMITINALIASLDGKRVERGSVECNIDDANHEAKELAISMLKAGGAKILEEIRSNNVEPDA